MSRATPAWLKLLYASLHAQTHSCWLGEPVAAGWLQQLRHLPPPAADLVAEQSKIRDIESTWAKEAAAKDLEKSVSHYTDDAILMSPGVPAAKGKDAIHAAWKALLDDPNLSSTSPRDRVEISASGDLATTKGSYTMTVTNPKTKKPVEDKGSYVTVL